LSAASASGWLPVLAARAARAAEQRTPHKSCILLWMYGGPPHLDTFDLKPGTPTGGEFQSIATSVPGIEICEHLPQLATLMHHGAIIRSMSTKEADHDRGKYLMHTGYPRSNGGVPRPNLGAIVSRELGQPEFMLPNFVVCNLSQGLRLDPTPAGFLGPRHRGLILPAEASRGIQDVKPPVGSAEFRRRTDLLTQLEDAFRGRYRSDAAAAHQANYERSLDLMRAEQLKAFDVSLEPEAGRNRYTASGFGQGCLMARRLVEVGVPFIEVVHANWDTHSSNFPTVKGHCANDLDPNLGALITDLHERGLLENTLVIWMGEFGRTPKINPNAGRDHYARAWSTVLLGGGIKGGQVIGRTDEGGVEVEDRPVSAADFLATVCTILGIDTGTTYDGPGGRTVWLVDQGAEPIWELVGS
jgi:hypothetical protein